MGKVIKCFKRFDKDHFIDLGINGSLVIEMAFEEEGCEKGVNWIRSPLLML